MTRDRVSACSSSLGIELSFLSHLDTLPPAGRIQFCTSNWESISDDPWILAVVQGYRLELASAPWQKSSPHGRAMSTTEQSWVSEEVEKLLVKQAIKEVEERAVSGREEGRLSAPSGQPEATEPLHHETEVQDGRHQGHQGSSSAGRLDDLHRPEGCLPVGGDCSGAQEIPQIQVEGEPFRVPVSAVWPQQCTTGLHQAHCGSSVRKGCTLHPVSGRHASDGPDERSNICRDCHFAAGVGLSDQLGEECAGPNTSYPVPGADGGLNADDSCPAGRQMERHNTGMPVGRKEDPPFSPRVGQADWQDDGNSNGSPTSTVVLQEPTASSSPHLRFLRGHPSQPECERGVAVVGMRAPQVEWQANPALTPRHRDRCLTSGLGCSGRWGEHGGFVVREQTPEPHQPPRDAGGSLGSPDVCEGQDSVSCVAENGQQDGDMLHKPHGGDQIPITVTHCLPAVGVVPPEGDTNLSRTSPGLVQCDSRSGVTDTPVLSRVEARRDCIPGSVEDLWPVQGRSLCFQTEQPAPTLRQLETRPICNGDGCLSVAVDTPSSIRFPSLCTNWEMPAEDSPGAGDSATHSSSLAHPNMVSGASGNGGPLSDTATLPQGPPARSLQQGTPSVGQQTVAPSRLESIRRAHTSGRASEIISAGWRKGTNSAYQSGWLKWGWLV